MNLPAPTPIEKINMYRNALNEINDQGSFFVGERIGLCYFISASLGKGPNVEIYNDYIPTYYPEITKKAGSICNHIPNKERKPFIEQQIQAHLTAIKFNFRFSQKQFTTQ